MQEHYQYEGVSQAVDLLLQGKINVPESALKMKGAKTLLQHLSDKNNPLEMNCDIDLHTFTTTMRKWPEGTSTSPSGRHLGHYKCLFADDKQDHKYTQLNPDPKGKIMEVYFKIATASLCIGASLEWWQQSITTMIKKTPGNPKINKLRVIHLYEADDNLLLKIIWARRLVWHAHDADRINEGQAGSRPGINEIDVVIQKEMKYFFSIITRTGLATMDNAAKSCYNNATWQWLYPNILVSMQRLQKHKQQLLEKCSLGYKRLLATLPNIITIQKKPQCTALAKVAAHHHPSGFSSVAF
jgi:hypothetical protein